MPHLSKGSKSNFQLIFSKIPGTTVNEDLPFHLNITNTIVPSIDIGEIEIGHLGGRIYTNAGIEYGEWLTTFHIDAEFNSYYVMYDWMMYIYNGDVSHKQDNIEIDADLIMTDNFNNVTSTLRFNNIWPKALGEVDLSYQDGNEKLESTVTFKYDRFIRL